MTDGAVFQELAARLALLAASAGAVPFGIEDEAEGDASGVTFGIGRAVVLGEGGGAPGWARALAGLGVQTLWLVPDADDARRLGEMLAQHERRSGRPAGFTLAADPAVARGADLLVIPDALLGLATGIEPLLARDAVVIGAGDRALLDTLARALARPERLAGLHLAPPVSLTALAEILPGAAATPTRRAVALARRMRRQPVLLPPGADCPSLSLTSALWEEADTLLLRGATPWEMDEAIEGARWVPPGPCLRQDVLGLDYACALRHRHARQRERAVAPIAPRMLAEGRLGQRGGVGWYRYPGGGGPVIDPLMEDMCTEEAHFARITRRIPDDAEVVARLTLALIDEAALLAAQTGPVLPDMVALGALGFPAHTGGPLRLAQTLGLPVLQDALSALALENPARWADAPARVAAALAQM